MSEGKILCPVCGGPVVVVRDDKVNRCEYCASPVLGPSQSRDCVDHPGTLATGVCHVCGDLICDECTEVRVGDYGGKLLTIKNCSKKSCRAESEWAKPLNIEYQRLTNMDWADRSDNIILRVNGLGAILMMVFELVFIITMLFLQYFSPHSGVLPSYIFPGDAVVVISIIGNLVSALLLQTALQVYVHERQLGSGIALMAFLIIEAVLLIGRGLYFNLLTINESIPWLVPLFLGAFGIAVLMVFFGSIAAIYNGYRKYRQFKQARYTLGLS